MICYPLDNTEYTAAALGAYHCTRTRGVFSADDNLAVNANDSMSITVKPGLAWLKWSQYWGTSVLQEAEVILDLETASGNLNRIDAVVCRIDKQKNKAELVIKKGSLASTPVIAEPVRNDNYDEIYIATIRVNAGAIRIVQADVTDQRGNETYCGLMRDSVTGIPTAQLQAQADELIQQLRDAIAKEQTETCVKAGDIITDAEIDALLAT